MYGCQPNKELKTFIYGESDNGTIFHASKSEYKKFDVHEYKENISKKQITIDILGTKYTGVYTHSAKLPQSDWNVHVYELQGTDGGKVLIDAKTNTIVEYVSIPYPENPVTESDYNEFIKRMLGDEYDLTKYDYTCKTHYFSESSRGFRSQEVDGFRILKENERLVSRSFYYNRSEDGVTLEDHISAIFYDDTFFFEVYEHIHDLKDYSPILNRMDEVEKNIENLLRENVKDGYTFVSIEHNSKNAFIQDGVPYVMVTSTVTYIYHGQTFSTLIQTITG